MQIRQAKAALTYRGLAQQLLKIAGDVSLSEEVRRDAERDLSEIDALLEADPLQGWEPHSAQQREFMGASTRLQAAFAGNRFGKTTALVVKALIQHIPTSELPEHLRPYKLSRDGEPVFSFFLCPSFKVFETVDMPAFKKWVPKRILRGGSWDRAWDKKFSILHLADGGQVSVFTYDQDPDKMVGAALDYVAYDEPPPEAHRRECRIRLADRDGFEMFAMTPVNMQGGGIGWIYRRVWKRREDPDVTVIQASIHDNPLLTSAAVSAALDEYPEDERRAREFGEFVHVGGMIYPGGFEHHLADPPSPQRIRDFHHVVGVDPGLKNAAFVWVAFDEDNRAFVFDEVLLQERTPADYARAIRATNAKWGLERPLYVIDPSARNRSLTNAESVEGELGRLGIHCVHGQNAVEAGVQQVRRRMQGGMLLVSRECRGLRDEAEEYRAEDRPDGEFKVVKENDHRLDALRYAVMARPWHPRSDSRPQERLGWVPGTALPADQLIPHAPLVVGPMGDLS